MFGTNVAIRDHKMPVGRVWRFEMKQGQPIKAVPVSSFIKY